MKTAIVVSLIIITGLTAAIGAVSCGIDLMDASQQTDSFEVGIWRQVEGIVMFGLAVMAVGIAMEFGVRYYVSRSRENHHANIT